MAPTERTKQVHLLVSAEEHEEVQAMAAAHNMTVSDYVRHAIGVSVYRAYKARPASDTEAAGILMKAQLAKWDLERTTNGARLPAKDKK